MNEYKASECKAFLLSDDLVSRHRGAVFAGSLGIHGTSLLQTLANLVIHESKRDRPMSDLEVKCVCRAIDSIGLIATASRATLDSELVKHLDTSFRVAIESSEKSVVASVVQAIERGLVGSHTLIQALAGWRGKLSPEWNERLLIVTEGAKGED